MTETLKEVLSSINNFSDQLAVIGIVNAYKNTPGSDIQKSASQYIECSFNETSEFTRLTDYFYHAKKIDTKKEHKRLKRYLYNTGNLYADIRNQLDKILVLNIK